MNPNYATGVSVSAQEDDPASFLNFTRHLLRLRRATPALIIGEYRALDVQNASCLGFLRHHDATGQTCLVLMNFSDTAQPVVCDMGGKQPDLLFAHQQSHAPLAHGTMTLAPFAIIIAALVGEPAP